MIFRILYFELSVRFFEKSYWFCSIVLGWVTMDHGHLSFPGHCGAEISRFSIIPTWCDIHQVAAAVSAICQKSRRFSLFNSCGLAVYIKCFRILIVLLAVIFLDALMICICLFRTRGGVTKLRTRISRLTFLNFHITMRRLINELRLIVVNGFGLRDDQRIFIWFQNAP